ncbi:MAG: hypothetical protein AAGC85_15050 [Bacteroidota bacterium]
MAWDISKWSVKSVPNRLPNGLVADCQKDQLGSQNGSFRIEMAADPLVHALYPTAMTG